MDVALELMRSFSFAAQLATDKSSRINYLNSMSKLFQALRSLAGESKSGYYLSYDGESVTMKCIEDSR